MEVGVRERATAQLYELLGMYWRQANEMERKDIQGVSRL